MGEFRPFIGSSSLHNSVARGLHADAEAQALLRASPSPGTSMPTIAAHPSDISIMERTEPTMVRGVTAAWRGTDKWSSEATLLENFGDVRFDLAADLSMTVQEYLAYAGQTKADFPYYIYEREYVGDSARYACEFDPARRIACVWSCPWKSITIAMTRLGFQDCKWLRATAVD